MAATFLRTTFSLAIFMATPALLAQTSEATTANQTSTISAPSSTSTTTQDNWTLQFRNDTTSNLEKAKKQGGADSENNIKYLHSINGQNQVGLQLGFKYDLANDTQNQNDMEPKLNDLALVGVHEGESVLGSDKTIIEGKILLPTSEDSQLNKVRSTLKADITLPYTITNRIKAELYTNPKQIIYTDGNNVTKLKSSAKIGYGQALVGYVGVNHKVELRTANVYKRTAESFGPEVGTEYTLNKNFKVAFGVSQYRNILNPNNRFARKNVAIFDTKETEYNFVAKIKY